LDERRERRIEVAFGARMQDMELHPRVRAACRPLVVGSVTLGLVGLATRPMIVAVGTSAWSNSSRFGATSTLNEVTPVTLPPCRLRLATRPICTGSLLVVDISGSRSGCR
jgi:hypothetical protein